LNIFFVFAFIFSILILILGLFWLRKASSPQIFGKVLRSVSTNEKVIALTFDDGPNPHVTLDILKTLSEHSAKAAFFVLGENAEKYPDIIKHIIDGGHELGNHTWSHTRLTFKAPDTIYSQINKTDIFLKEKGYEGTIHFRAPFGHKLFILPYILMKTKRQHVLWNIKLDDWDSPPPADMLKAFDEKIIPGSIILLHDGYTDERSCRDATIDFVKMVVSEYTEKGYRFVTVSELLTYQKV